MMLQPPPAQALARSEQIGFFDYRPPLLPECLGETIPVLPCTAGVQASPAATYTASSRMPQHRPLWGFPKIMGTILGVPIIRTIAFWGLYWGLPILGNYLIMSWNKHCPHRSPPLAAGPEATSKPG